MLIDDDPEFHLTQRASRAGASGAAGRGATPAVLLADGCREEREALAGHLRAAGFAVRTAADGLAALYALDRERPDLVVLDLELPMVSGFRLVHLLKRGAPDAPP